MLAPGINFINFGKVSDKKNIKKKFRQTVTYKKYPFILSLSENYKYSFSKIKLNKIKKNKYFRLIGMGGSILGAEAIYNFLNHKIKKKFIFINNLKPNLSVDEKFNKAFNIIISKSGNTLETISNTNKLLNKKNIIITENNKNYLRNVAQKLSIEIADHKNFIGGRYSVLSEAGMLPAELMGFNPSKFKIYNKLINNKNFLNQLYSNVNFTLNFIKKRKINSIILNYDEKSESLFRWYQQLIAESLGKKSKGILPIISSMPKDNHSLMQLYLDGPKKNFFTFFSVEEKSEKLNKFIIDKSFLNLKNKSLYEIIDAQKKATQIVFKKQKIPFRSFKIIKRNENTLGGLFCFFMLEVVLLSKALKVNPLDQPAVELIKNETKKILIK